MSTMRIFVCNNTSVAKIFADLEKFRHSFVRNNRIVSWDIGVAKTLKEVRYTELEGLKAALALTKTEGMNRRLGWSLGLTQDELNDQYWSHVLPTNAADSFKISDSVISRTTLEMCSIDDDHGSLRGEELDTFVRSAWLVSRFTQALKLYEEPVCVIMRDQPGWNDRLTKLAV